MKKIHKRRIDAIGIRYFFAFNEKVSYYFATDFFTRQTQNFCKRMKKRSIYMTVSDVDTDLQNHGKDTLKTQTCEMPLDSS